MRLRDTTPSPRRPRPTPAHHLALFFIQTRSTDRSSLWLYLYPVDAAYGYLTIEAAERSIGELEAQDEDMGLEFEYRIKEELVQVESLYQVRS